MDRDNRKGELGAICVLVDPVARTTKYVKPANLIISKTKEGNPFTVGDLINNYESLKNQNEKLVKAIESITQSIELMNSNIESLKVEVM